MALNNVYLAQINLHKSYPVNVVVNEVIQTEINQDKIVILGLTEPSTNKDEKVTVFNSKNVVQYRKKKTDSDKLMVRAALYGSDSCLLPFPAFCEPDLVAARLNVPINDGKFTEFMLCSHYMDIEKPVFSKTLEKLVIYCERKKLPLILMADTNSHNKLWGNLDDNDRGKDLLPYLLKYDLLWHNVGQVPTAFTYYRHNAKSVIDLTITNRFAREYIHDWKITSKVCNSDHMLIDFKLDLEFNPIKMYRNLKRGSWIKFRRILSNIDWDLAKTTYTIEDIETAVAAFETHVTAALDESHPLKQQPRGTAKEWYDEDVKAAQKKVKKAHDKWRNNDRSVNLHDQLKTARKNLRKLIYKKQRKAWQGFVTGLPNYKDVAAYKRMLTADHTNQMGTLQNSDGEFLCPQKSLELMAATHFPECMDDDAPINANVQGTDMLFGLMGTAPPHVRKFR